MTRPLAVRGIAILAAMLASCPARADAPPQAPDGGVALPACTGSLCGFSHPEDIAALAGTRWLVVSQQSDEDHAKGLVLLDTASGARTDIATPPASGTCIDGRGGGIGIRREAGGYRLQRIVHGTGDVVETWRLSVAGGRIVAARTACTPATADLFLNDIAPLPDGGFVATHMFDRALPKPARDAMFLSGTPTGALMRWSPSTGWHRIPGSDGVFPNGVDVSADGHWIAFAETYGHRIDRIRADGSSRTSVALAMQPDNVTAAGGGRFVVVGGTGAPMASTRNCAALGKAGCAFPAAALMVDFRTASPRVLARSAGRATPGFSVGLVADRALWLGTSFGDRITRVALSPTPAALP